MSTLYKLHRDKLLNGEVILTPIISDKSLFYPSYIVQNGEVYTFHHPETTITGTRKFILEILQRDILKELYKKDVLQITA